MTFDMDPRMRSNVHRGSKFCKDTVYPKYIRETKEPDDNFKATHYGNWLPINSNQTHFSRRCFANSFKENELVKYMSRLPRYVQHLDSTETSQNKAFNVGVLELSRGKRDLDRSNFSLHRRYESPSLEHSENRTQKIINDKECSSSKIKEDRRKSDGLFNGSSESGKITRSFSFKESSFANQTPRDSPFKGVLDPLNKSKNSSASNSQRESLRHNPESSYQHAQLHVFMKNKVPLFRFSSESNQTVLAATQNFTEKFNSGKSYEMYSIDELKKKRSGWINYPSKEQKSAFVYNVIGKIEMNASTFALFDCDKSSRREIGAMEIPAGNEVTVLLPGAVHTMPTEGCPSSLIQRWRSNGACDCGG